jgi:hypothetical protein
MAETWAVIDGEIVENSSPPVLMDEVQWVAVGSPFKRQEPPFIIIFT